MDEYRFHKRELVQRNVHGDKRSYLDHLRCLIEHMQHINKMHQVEPEFFKIVFRPAGTNENLFERNLVLEIFWGEKEKPEQENIVYIRNALQERENKDGAGEIWVGHDDATTITDNLDVSGNVSEQSKEIDAGYEKTCEVPKDEKKAPAKAKKKK